MDEVFPEQPVRQWVLSFPYPLRFLFASRPAIMGRVLGIVYRVIATHLIKKAGFSRETAQAVCAARNPRLFAAVALQTENHSILNGSFRTAALAHGSMRTQA